MPRSGVPRATRSERRIVSARIAAALSLPDDRRESLLYAGLLSDVGTIGPGPDPDPDTARTRRAESLALSA